jgi:hypothetical protein
VKHERKCEASERGWAGPCWGAVEEEWCNDPYGDGDDYSAWRCRGHADMILVDFGSPGSYQVEPKEKP